VYTKDGMIHWCLEMQMRLQVNACLQRTPSTCFDSVLMDIMKFLICREVFLIGSGNIDIDHRSNSPSLILDACRMKRMGKKCSAQEWNIDYGNIAC
jgi:hypothetical protein